MTRPLSIQTHPLPAQKLEALGIGIVYLFGRYLFLFSPIIMMMSMSVAHAQTPALDPQLNDITFEAIVPSHLPCRRY